MEHLGRPLGKREDEHSLLPWGQQLWELRGTLTPHTVERGSISSFIYGETEAPRWIDTIGNGASRSNSVTSQPWV